MQNKIDIIIDVSKKLTQQWVTARTMGIDHPEAWIYAEMPNLLNDTMPAHFGLVMKELLSMNTQKAAFILESMSSGLYELCVMEGLFTASKER